MSLKKETTGVKQAATFEWNPNLAYVVGLITTDGNLSKDGRHIDFTSKDIELINVFKCCLGLEVKTGVKSSGFTNGFCYRVQFGNIELYNWLLRIGLTPNKTKTLHKLDIPNEFFFDFLRGHLDGDGYIYTYQDPRWPNSKLLYTNFGTCSLNHLYWIRARLGSLLNIHGHISAGNKMYRLRYAKYESMTLLPKMYYGLNIPCLQRKRVIAEPFLNVPR